jgi:hypothetical protein
MPVGCDHFVVRDCEAAQAVELVRALRHQLHEMTTHLAGWNAKMSPAGTAGHARCAWKQPSCAETYKRHSFSSIGDSAVT